MYQYLVDLFPQAAGSPQAPPPPRALFEDFFSPASTPHQPVYLSWFERVRSALSEADARVALLLASGRSESSPRSAQYAVKGEHALGSAVPVNPSLLVMFNRPLRPSLYLGLTVREAALLEASSRSLSESLSHAMWLLSGLLGFVRLQGFAPSDAALFNMLVTSLSKCLAHQASLAASHTAFVGLKRRQFYLSHLPAYFSEVNKRAMLAFRYFALIPYSRSRTSLVFCLTPKRRPPFVLSRLWSTWRLGVPGLGVGVSSLFVHRLAILLLGVAAGILALPVASQRGSVLTLRLLLPLWSPLRVFRDRSLVPRLAR